MKLVWCPDTASKAYIDGVRAIAADAEGSPELAELLAAMAGGWNAQLIVDAPASPPSSSSRRPPAATSLALAAAARRTGGRYARLDAVVPTSTEEEHDADDDSGSSSSSSAAATEAAAMARLEGVDLLVLDARRRDAAAVLRAARPGPRGMVVVRHGGNNVVRRGRAAAAPPWGMAAGTRVVRAAYLPIGAGGVEVLHVGVGKQGPSLLPPSQSQHSVRRPAGRGRWIRHVNHRTGEEHVFRRQ